MQQKTNQPGFFQRFKGLETFFLLWIGQTVSTIGSAATASALIIWAYGQSGTVMSVALLSVCSYLPAALVAMFAGTLADKVNKKRLMLIADSAAALLTCTVWLLWANGALRVEHLYLINAVLGVVNAFQNPASAASISAMVPKEQYMRVSGLQSLSGSLSGILSPVLAGALIGLSGLGAVLAVDLATFAFAFITLLCFVKIPSITSPDAGEPFFARMAGGVKFLAHNKGVTHIIYYLMVINLIAGIAFYSVLSPMILARTGNDALAMGTVNAFIGIGTLVGALLTTVVPIRVKKVTLMCVAYMLSFAMCDIPMGLGRTLPLWCIAAFMGNMTLPFGDGALSTLLRTNIPLSMQGRVFAARHAIVSCATTAGFLLGAWLADTVCPALVADGAPLAPFLNALLGVGEGRAMGLVFVFTGLTGIVASLSLMRSKAVRNLASLD